MKLSIVMPSFNKPSYLIEMIKTIQKQTFKDWELIIVDDGSEEQNFAQVFDFVSEDKRISLVKRDREPKNGDTCRNIGMDMAKGAYLIIFDSDDLVPEFCFEQRVRFMDDHPDCDYASFPSVSFYNGTNNFRARKFDRSIIDTFDRILKADYPFTVWGNIYRRESLNDIRWDEKVFLYQDFDFMVQCEIKGLKHYWADKDTPPDYYYRIFDDGNSVCAKVVSRQKVDSTNYLILKTARLLKERNDYNTKMILFFRFVLNHLDQLLIDYNKDYMESFMAVIKTLYPYEYLKMKKVTDRRGKCEPTHFNLGVMYAQLYFAFKVPIHRTYSVHEFGKWLLRR